VATAWVVKLGGSLARGETLPGWLEALANARVAVVPGGGPFADQVRAAQARWRFGDDAAHRMALLAMAQYGHMLAGLQPALATASAPERLAAILAEGRSAVWLPDPEALEPAALPASWELTSDSLSAWLAGRLGIPRLLLVKYAPLPVGSAPVETLIQAGLLDPAFAGFARAAGCAAWVCGAASHADVAERLARPDTRFTRVILHHQPKRENPYADPSTLFRQLARTNGQGGRKPDL
jgi:aspartokinase-like uncharacterized kinase